MSLEQKQNKQGTSPIVEARSLLSNGDERGAFAVLREGASRGNVMACYDAGFMIFQGIGCEEDWEGGLELIEKGRKLEEGKVNDNWKSDGSATDVLGPQSVHFRGFEISESEVLLLSQALKVYSTINKLFFEGNCIGDSGASLLSEALKVNSSITLLSLKDNRVGDSGAKVIGEMLEVNSTLLTLGLETNQIGSDGGKAIAKGIEKNSTLKQLWLGWNDIGAEGTVLIGKALKINSKLSKLGMNNTKFGESGERALSEGKRDGLEIYVKTEGGNYIPL